MSSEDVGVQSIPDHERSSHSKPAARLHKNRRLRLSRDQWHPFRRRVHRRYERSVTRSDTPGNGDRPVHIRHDPRDSRPTGCFVAAQRERSLRQITPPHLRCKPLHQGIGLLGGRADNDVSEPFQLGDDSLPTDHKHARGWGNVSGQQPHGGLRCGDNVFGRDIQPQLTQVCRDRAVTAGGGVCDISHRHSHRHFSYALNSIWNGHSTRVHHTIQVSKHRIHSEQRRSSTGCPAQQVTSAPRCPQRAVSIRYITTIAVSMLARSQVLPRCSVGLVPATDTDVALSPLGLGTTTTLTTADSITLNTTIDTDITTTTITITTDTLTALVLVLVTLITYLYNDDDIIGLQLKHLLRALGSFEPCRGFTGSSEFGEHLCIGSKQIRTVGKGSVWIKLRNFQLRQCQRYLSEVESGARQRNRKRYLHLPRKRAPIYGTPCLQRPIGPLNASFAVNQQRNLVVAPRNPPKCSKLSNRKPKVSRRVGGNSERLAHHRYTARSPRRSQRVPVCQVWIRFQSSGCRDQVPRNPIGVLFRQRF